MVTNLSAPMASRIAATSAAASATDRPGLAVEPAYPGREYVTVRRPRSGCAVLEDQSHAVFRSVAEHLEHAAIGEFDLGGCHLANASIKSAASYAPLYNSPSMNRVGVARLTRG